MEKDEPATLKLEGLCSLTGDGGAQTKPRHIVSPLSHACPFPGWHEWSEPRGNRVPKWGPSGLVGGRVVSLCEMPWVPGELQRLEATRTCVSGGLQPYRGSRPVKPLHVSCRGVTFEVRYRVQTRQEPQFVPKIT